MIMLLFYLLIIFASEVMARSTSYIIVLQREIVFLSTRIQKACSLYSYACYFHFSIKFWFHFNCNPLTTMNGSKHHLVIIQLSYHKKYWKAYAYNIPELVKSYISCTTINMTISLIASCTM